MSYKVQKRLADGSRPIERGGFERVRAIKGPQKAVLMCLGSYCNEDATDAWPSAQTIAEDMGLTRRTVMSALKALKRSGAISDIGVSPFRTRKYRINFDALEYEAPSHVKDVHHAAESEGSVHLTAGGVHFTHLDREGAAHKRSSKKSKEESFERSIYLSQNSERLVSQEFPELEGLPRYMAAVYSVSVEEIAEEVLTVARERRIRRARCDWDAVASNVSQTIASSEKVAA